MPTVAGRSGSRDGSPEGARRGRRRADNVGRDERGDVIIGGMLRTVLFLLAIGLAVYELVAVAVNTVQLDEMAVTAARAAADAAAAGAGTSGAETAVLATLQGEEGVFVEGVTLGPEGATVTVSREPFFLVADRVPALRERLLAHASSTAALR